MPTRTFYSLGEEQAPNRNRDSETSGVESLPVAALRASLKDVLPKSYLKSTLADTNTVKHQTIHIPQKEELFEVFDMVKDDIVKGEAKISNFFSRFKKHKTEDVEVNHPNPVLDSSAATKSINLEQLPKTNEIKPKAVSFQNNESFEPKNTVEPQFIQSMLFDTATRIEQKYRKLILGLLSLFVLLIVINLYTVFYLNFSNRSTPVLNAQTTAIVPNLQQIKSPEEGLKIVREFAGNSALADIGFQLDVQKNTVKTKGSPNCKTPILPPFENGCHFLLIPGALGVPSRGVIYKSVGIDASLSEGDKIQVDIKNYEKDQSQTIATIDSTNITQDFVLPENIPTSSGLMFRLWAKNQEISIKQINVRYFSVDDLKQVSGTLAGDISKIEEVPKLYFDKNQNGKLDKDIDTQWVCRPNFPGAKVTVSTDGKFVIEPDDACFVDVKPDCWYKTKVNKCALPIGKWLLGYDTKPIVIPFEIKDNTDSLVLKAK